jgi:hypothetical protein
MGENGGVLGADEDERPTRAATKAMLSNGRNGKAGKESQVDVTYSVFSNARQYWHIIAYTRQHCGSHRTSYPLAHY